MKPYSAVLLVSMAISVSPTMAYAQSDNLAPRQANTMSIIGKGEHWVAPEIAEFSGKVVTSGNTLAEARDPHPEIVQEVRAAIEELTARGLKIETARYSLQETFPSQFNTSIADSQRGKPIFVATTSFKLSTENLTELADLISTLAAGELQISDIHFGVSNERLPLLEARKEAARDALEQASAYADALGISLVEIRSITDGDATPPDYGSADLMVMVGPDGQVPLTIAVPDLLPYSASVTVDWTIGSMQP